MDEADRDGGSVRIHAAQGLPEYDHRVIIERVRAGKPLEEHQPARDCDGLVQTRREHAVLERELVLLRSGRENVRFDHLSTQQS